MGKRSGRTRRKTPKTPKTPKNDEHIPHYAHFSPEDYKISNTIRQCKEILNDENIDDIEKISKMQKIFNLNIRPRQIIYKSSGVDASPTSGQEQVANV